MAVLNLRGIADNLAEQLKTEAVWAGMGYHEYCVAILERREDYRISVLREEKEKRLGKIISPIFRLEAEETDRHGNVVPRKKIANISVGGGATEGEGDPCLPRGGKAQDGDLSRTISERLAKRIPRTEKELAFLRKMGGRELGNLREISVEEIDEMKEIAKVDIGIAKMLHINGVPLDREILVRWGLAENYKPQTDEPDSLAPRPDLDFSKGVRGTLLRVEPVGGWDICEGKGIRPAPLSAEPVEIDLCGFKSYNEGDGEWYVCAKGKHGIKINHGDWLKV